MRSTRRGPFEAVPADRFFFPSSQAALHIVDLADVRGIPDGRGTGTTSMLLPAPHSTRWQKPRLDSPRESCGLRPLGRPLRCSDGPERPAGRLQTIVLIAREGRNK